MKNDIEYSFNNLAKFYDEWRQKGQFYEKFERKIVLSIFNEIINILPSSPNILDIGCGTGLWTKEMFNYFNSKFTIGIDNSVEMIKVAYKNNKYNDIFFDLNDCSSLKGNQYSRNSFNFITSALSMDYIGTFETLSVIKSNLASGGLSLIWFFDPNRYEGVSTKIEKRWLIKDKEVKIISNRIRLKDILHYTNILNLKFKLFYKSLPTVQRIQRGIYFLLVSSDNTILEQMSNFNLERKDIGLREDTKANKKYTACRNWL